MRNGAFSHMARLPRESELAQQLKISRTPLRDSLALLKREDFISRSHGVGTVIKRHVLNVRTRMELGVEFMDMVRQSGHSPSQAFVKPETIACPADVAKRLAIDEGTPVLCVSRLITADGKPAIYCKDYVEKSRIQKEITVIRSFNNLFSFS
jgi:GntR family transcriptional regulator